jgi:hemerythrin-like domain-containing protein
MTTSQPATRPVAQPVQVRLPGQAAAPTGPLDLTMMFVVHRAFRRDLENFAAAAARTPVSDRAAWAALAERWQLFAESLHHHHSVEDDRLWPALEAGALATGEHDAQELLTAMAAEHSQIDPLLEAVGEGFRRLAASADDDVRAALAVRTAAAREQLGRHLAHEETDALALAQRVLAPAEWNAVLAAFNAGLGLRELSFLVPWVLYELPRPAARRITRGKDRVLAVLNVVFRRRWLRRERIAFRHV